MLRSEPVEHIPGVGERVFAAIRRGRLNQRALAKKAGMSRQTLSTVISKDLVSRPVAERIATALGVSGPDLFPEIIPLSIETESGTLEIHGGPTGFEQMRKSADPLAADIVERPIPRVLRTHKVRVWLSAFRLELTKARLSDDQIREAIDLVTAPQVFDYYKAGRGRELTEDEAVVAMEAIATGLRRLAARRRTADR